MVFPKEKERQTSTEMRRRIGVEAIGDVTRRCGLRWRGHVERRSVKTCTRLVEEEMAPVGSKVMWYRTPKRWLATIIFVQCCMSAHTKKDDKIPIFL